MSAGSMATIGGGEGLTGAPAGGVVTSEWGTRSTLSAASWRSWEFVCT